MECILSFKKTFFFKHKANKTPADKTIIFPVEELGTGEAGKGEC